MTAHPAMHRFDLLEARVRGVQSVLNNWLDKGFEPEIPSLPLLLPAGGTCAHVGASDGRYSYAMLEVAIALHGLRGRIEPHRVAIGDREGEVTLTTPRKINGHMGRAYAF